jgi:hypothetical protein
VVWSFPTKLFFLFLCKGNNETSQKVAPAESADSKDERPGGKNHLVSLSALEDPKLDNQQSCLLPATHVEHNNTNPTSSTV